MKTVNYARNALLGVTAAAFFGAPLSPSHNQNGPVLNAAVTFVTSKSNAGLGSDTSALRPRSEADVALDALGRMVGELSDPRALGEAFHGYFAYKTAHPEDVKKPYLY